MAQVLKDEVRERICSAALRTFAARGYGATTVAGVGRAAGVSTGNVYRYFPSKLALFRAVVPGKLVRRLRELVRLRVEALAGVRDVGALDPRAPYHVVSAELLDFCLAHRLEVVIVLNRAAGTAYAGFAEAMVQELAALASRHAASVGSPFEPRGPEGFVLEQIYRGFVAAMGRILEHFEREEEIRRALAAYGRYHLPGLGQLLG